MRAFTVLLSLLFFLIRAAAAEASFPDRPAAGKAPASALPAGGFYAGGGIAGTAMFSGPSKGWNYESDVSPAGSLWLGYRRQFLRYLGAQAGVVSEAGPIWVQLHPDTSLPSRAHSRNENGVSPLGLHLLFHAQSLLGPFGPVVLEPGFAYGVGWRWDRTIALRGPVREDYRFGDPYSSFGGILGASWYFGRYDQYAITGYYTLRSRLDTDALELGLGLGCKYAFRP
jgi:hypothetical protein